MGLPNEPLPPEGRSGLADCALAEGRSGLADCARVMVPTGLSVAVENHLWRVLNAAFLGLKRRLIPARRSTRYSIMFCSRIT